MPHNWEVYELVKRITERLIEAEYVKKSDELMIRGIIQIMIEDSGILRGE